ncbi:hypothetical protein AVEN_85623-1 [Araneus ventricosus]|uniref:Uncharacterized protein n=1 Tax=Araneus ventricosus TaxID=182803 RepID=A0A4Y2NPZ5_ARAVE|nr:hypothetical protein AVEN_85623-1 [Araneus ventricosus]
MNLTSSLQVCLMVTSKFALTCCSLVTNLRSCRAELAASLQTCGARLLKLCGKLKLLYGITPEIGPGHRSSTLLQITQSQMEHYQSMLRHALWASFLTNDFSDWTSQWPSRHSGFIR